MIELTLGNIAQSSIKYVTVYCPLIESPELILSHSLGEGTLAELRDHAGASSIAETGDAPARNNR